MLKPVCVTDQGKIHQWRNSPEVRDVMFSNHEITWDEHLEWWNKVKEDKTKQIFLFCNENEELGVIYFFDIDHENKTCHWGFYFGELENIEEKTKFVIWQALEEETIEYAFREMAVEQLICETFEFNKAVLLVHLRNGFKKTDEYLKDRHGDCIRVIETTLSRQDWLVSNNEIILETKESKNISLREESLSLVVFGSTNLDFLQTDIKNKFNAYSVKVNNIQIPFGQHRIQLSDPESDLRKSKPDLVVFFERLEDMGYTSGQLTGSLRKIILDNWNEYLESLEYARQCISGIFFVSTIINIDSTKDKFIYDDESLLLNSFIDKLNKKLLEKTAVLPDVYVTDISSLIGQVGRNYAHPGKYWYLARVPFSHSFAEAMSQRIIGSWLALKGKTARVIILDLDNTLWGGVIGDDGISGIELGGSYPGNVFVEIQKLFKGLSKQGFVLAICSKNTEAVALEVFRKHPEMVLSEESFVYKTINWLPKPENIKLIAKELDLGLSNICFIDDNPAEREEVRLSLPNVYVPELPAEISDWPEFVKRLPELSTINLTEEDRNKTQQYNIRNRIKESQLSATSRDDFLCGLDMKLSFELLNKINKQRVSQLIAKTNQFNTMVHRYSENRLLELSKVGSVWGIRIKDRLGSDEIIGVLVVQPDNERLVIDNFLLSCRVLGRGLDTAVLSWCISFALKNGYKNVVAEINKTERNMPVYDIYANYGFHSFGDNIFQIEANTKALKMPDWFEIIED